MFLSAYSAQNMAHGIPSMNFIPKHQLIEKNESRILALIASPPPPQFWIGFSSVASVTVTQNASTNK